MTIFEVTSDHADAWACRQPEFVRAVERANKVRSKPFVRAARLPNDMKAWPDHFQNVVIPYKLEAGRLELNEALVYNVLIHCYRTAREVVRCRAVVVAVRRDPASDPTITADVIVPPADIEREARHMYDELDQKLSGFLGVQAGTDGGETP